MSGVSGIVVQYGPPDLLLSLIDSLTHHENVALISELVIVDNGGGLGDTGRRRVEAAAESLNVRFVETQGTSYSGGVNAGVRACSGDLVLVMNNDLMWAPDLSVRPLEDAMLDETVGIAGPQLLNEDGSWQRSFGRFPSVSSALESLFFIDTLRNARAAGRMAEARTGRPKAVHYVDGAMMCVRRRCFDEIGGLDESLPFYGEDTDFCRRAAIRGWTVAFVPAAGVVHVRGATSTREDPAGYERKLYSSKIRFVRRTGGAARASWYARILKAALAVRAGLYPIAAAAAGTESARARAAAAQKRYAAVRDLPATGV